QLQLSCSNYNARGAVQAFWYKSDTIAMYGVPPTNGWHFRYGRICCRPNFDNLLGGAVGVNIFRAVMYPDLNNLNAYPCTNSSPTFSAVPTIPKCMGFKT